jgi:hypothetical protein
VIEKARVFTKIDIGKEGLTLMLNTVMQQRACLGERSGSKAGIVAEDEQHALFDESDDTRCKGPRRRTGCQHPGSQPTSHPPHNGGGRERLG